MHNGSSRMSEIFFALCKTVDTPISLGAWLRFKHDQLALAEMELPIGDYLDAHAFRLDYLVVSFLSKWKGLETGLDLKAEALRRFASSESSCAETNRRIIESRKGGLDPTISAIISMAKRKISSLLGPFSVFCIDERFGWGPGATDDIPRRSAFVDTKMHKLPISVSRRSLPLIRKVIEGDLHWSSAILGINVEDIHLPFSLLRTCFSLTEACVIDTVPKNAKTHRVIAKEPRANGFLQKGAGAYIRKRLQRVGIDLDDQSANQEGAKAAYQLRLATLDLKAASDSVALELVYELLPVDWAIALDDLRSHQAYLPDGTTITLQKFSSMGNGFTFELETLIFWAVSSSVLSFMSIGAAPLIYGDDIIVPSESSELVIRSLAFMGFQTNRTKSFTEGNFYESCGRHFFKGEEVTPVYQKEPIDLDAEVLRLGNRLCRFAYRSRRGATLLRELFPPWSVAWRYAGSSRYYQIPLGSDGDDGWILPADYFSSVPQDLNLG